MLPQDEFATLHELAQPGHRPLIAWAVVTIAALLVLVLGLAVRGTQFFFAFQGPPDASLIEVKFLVFAISWCWLGLTLFFTQRSKLVRQHGSFLVVLVLIGCAYLSVVRGPHKVEHKDFSNYFNAATHRW